MNNRILSRINADFIRNGAVGIHDDDIQQVKNRATDIKQKIKNNEALKKLFKDASTLISMIKDCWSGAYPQAPVWVISAAVFALLYVLSPVDLIPDIIPVLGLTDDAAVLALCLAITEKDVHKYRNWKNGNKQGAEV